jgi:hypothetical protein
MFGTVISGVKKSSFFDSLYPIVSTPKDHLLHDEHLSLDK